MNENENQKIKKSTCFSCKLLEFLNGEKELELSELVEKLGIEVESELGTDISDKFKRSINTSQNLQELINNIIHYTEKLDST